MIAARHVVAFVAGLTICATSNAASELDSARSDAENGTKSLEQRPCPAFGDRKYLRGMTDAQQLSNGAEKERLYQETALRQLQQIAGDPKLEQRQRSDLQALAGWSIAASMANWSLLQVAQQALANPLIASGQPYPGAGLEGARERVRRTADSGAMPAEAAAVLRRQAGALDRCVQSFNAAIFKLNQPQFDAAVDAAANLSELGRVEQQYRTREAASGGYAADSLDKLTARRTVLAEADRVARENASAVGAADAAKRRAEAEQRQAEMRARLPTHLAVAKRFAEASQSGNERAAVAELARDVVMVTPQGTFRGIDEVVGAVRRQSASGKGGSLGTPQIADDRIVSSGQSSGYRITTTFSFDADNRISRLTISL